MPRSGTKLLRDLLNRNPAIAIFPHETHFIPYLSARFRRFGDVSRRENFARMYAEVRRTIFFERMIERGVVFEEAVWHGLLRGTQFRDVIGALFEYYSKLTGCPIVGDKTPDYVTQVPLLHGMFPDAVFVHIIRDPRDYALSMHRAWGKSLDRAAHRWKHQIRKYRSDVASLRAHHCEIRYEDLIRSPQASLQSICDELNVAFSDSMGSLSEPAENLGRARGLLTIDAANSNKWRTELRLDQVARIELIAGNLMAELGYKVSATAGDQNLGPMQLLIHKLSDGIELYRFRVRDCGGVLAAFRQACKAYRYRGVAD